MNPIFEMINPYSQIIEQAKQLKNQIQNPKQIVEQLLASGQMSQTEFNSLMQQVQQIAKFMK